MKTQSPDTSLEAELVLIGMIRKAPVSKRFAFDTVSGSQATKRVCPFRIGQAEGRTENVRRRPSGK